MEKEGKLIFLDIDGTLTVPVSNTPPDSALRAVRSAQTRGNRVFICTGRNPAMFAPLRAYDFDGYVGCNGGYVECMGDVIYDHPLDGSVLKEVVEVLHRNGVFCTVEGKEASYGDEKLGDFLKGAPRGNSEIERWRAALAGNLNILPMSQYDGSPAYKVVFMCSEPSQLDEARSLFEDQFQFCFQDASAHHCVNGELVNRAFDKGRGALRVSRYLGVPVENTVAFGDSMNDLEMAEAVGVSVCMANGSEELKKHCSFICPPVDQDGLAEGFRRLGLD